MTASSTTRRLRGRRAVGALLCAAIVAAAPTLASASDNAGTASEGGLGAAAAITSLVYGPVKIAYATVGTVSAGLAWMFSGGDGEVASTVLTRAVRGTYVITPESLQGRREIEFVGRSPEYRSSSSPQVAAAPDGW